MSCNFISLYTFYKLLIVCIYPAILVIGFDKFECGETTKHGSIGELTSPGYPHSSRSDTNCTWHITGQPDDIITIQFADVNLDDSSGSCQNSWLELGPAADKKSKRYCGSNVIPPSFMSAKYRVWITYHISSEATKPGAGFRLIYSVQPKRSAICKRNQFHCKTGNCIPSQWTCNGRFECYDGSDEVNCKHICTGNKLHCGDGEHCFNQITQQCDGVWDCPNGVDELGCSQCKQNEFRCKSSTGCYDRHERCDNVNNCLDLSDELGCGQCKRNEVRCLSSRDCYDPLVHKCNGKFECLKGEDELSCGPQCPNKLNCKSGKGCYSPTQRCNSIANCADSSDEKNCSKEVCKREIGGFLCKNKMCIRESWICDQTNDCGDYSDEEGCVKNSVITAAVMGALICGLLLVIAVGCTCKLYTLRIIEHHDLNYETPMSQIEREFLQREPPPPYAIAVGGMPFYNQDQFSDHYRISFPVRPGRARRSSRRLCRHNSRRRRAPSPPPPILNQSSSGSHSPTTSTTSVQMLTNERTEVVTSPTTNTGSNSSSNNSNCDSNKELKPVSSAFYVLDSETLNQPVDKSDSSSESSVNSVSNNIDDNQIQLDTLTSPCLLEDDFTTDDMQSLCAS